VQSKLLNKIIDELDLKIIRSLSEDCTKPVTKIAKEVKSSRPTVIARLSYLRKEKIIDCSAKINIAKLGLKLASIHFETKDPESEEQLITTISKCPRLLQLFQISGKSTFLALVYTENAETLLSTIECLATVINAKIISFQRIIPLLDQTFHLKVIEKGDVTPCGKECGLCIAYKQNECYGCPSSTTYKGTL
jgi:Lrp/AsnC family transcriptional regulator, leucine-responsive regulatory protein